MELKFPLRFAEISLAQFVAFHAAKTDVQRVMAICDATYEEANRITPQSLRVIVDKFRELLEIPTAVQCRRFKVNGTEYGFIPDLTEMSMGEWVDLSAHAGQIWQDGKEPNYTALPAFLSILYRPITERIADRYRLAPYTGKELEEHAKAINSLTMDRVQGALLFFSTIRKKLYVASLRYLEDRMMEAIGEVNAELASLTD